MSDRYDSVYARAVQHIVEHGWGVMGVGAGFGDPQFAYTYGMVGSYAHPEFAIVGLPIPLMHALLNDMAGRVRDGTVFTAGDVVEDLIIDHQAHLVLVDSEKAGENLTMSAALLDVEVVPAFQIVWPDNGGRMPWDDGYSLPPEVQPVWGVR